MSRTARSHAAAAAAPASLLPTTRRAGIGPRAALALLLPALAVLPPAPGGLAAEPPPGLVAVIGAEPSRELSVSFAEEKRAAAMRAAAVSYGARAGLAHRGWEIGRLLERHAAQLSGIYRFRDLLLDEGGFRVLPPVASETRRAFRLGRDGAEAATARRVVRIVSAERLVSAPPDWRDYLVREWKPAEPPVSVLFPRDRGERRRWRRWIREGWAKGVALADDVFAADLDRLSRDFEGIVLWRRLNLANMATAPSVTLDDAPVSGGGRVLRIDEAFAKLGAPARLVPVPSEWRPLMEVPW